MLLLNEAIGKETLDSLLIEEAPNLLMSKQTHASWAKPKPLLVTYGTDPFDAPWLQLLCIIFPGPNSSDFSNYCKCNPWTS